MRDKEQVRKEIVCDMMTNAVFGVIGNSLHWKRTTEDAFDNGDGSTEITEAIYIFSENSGYEIIEAMKMPEVAYAEYCITQLNEQLPNLNEYIDNVSEVCPMFSCDDVDGLKEYFKSEGVNNENIGEFPRLGYILNSCGVSL